MKFYYGKDYFRHYAEEMGQNTAVTGAAGMVSIISGFAGANEFHTGGDQNLGLIYIIGALFNLGLAYWCRRSARKAREGLEKLMEINNEAADYAFTDTN